MLSQRRGNNNSSKKNDVDLNNSSNSNHNNAESNILLAGNAISSAPPLRKSRLRRLSGEPAHNNKRSSTSRNKKTSSAQQSSSSNKLGSFSMTCLIATLAVVISLGLLLSLFVLLVVMEDNNDSRNSSNGSAASAGGGPFWKSLRQPHFPSLRGFQKPRVGGGVFFHQQQQQRHGPRTVRKDENSTIDMRQLNYQLPFHNPDGGAWKQGWDVEPVPVDADKHPLTVYVLPHSHCDPGWIKTFDEYFQSQTKQIITVVVNALKKDARRRFIWAEISYFEWWWNEQDAATRQTVRSLLQTGQLEFVTGGWVQPDEANSELYAMEIQLQEGHDWIRNEFGEEYVPHYGWAIDPFGYSPTMAWLLQKYGFRAMLIQRVHYAVKKELAKRKHLEFYWRQTWDSAGEHDIFTHVMPFFSYDVPHTCGPDPSVCCQFDFKRKRNECPWRKDPQTITKHNVEERALLLWDQYRKKAALYRSNTLLVPLGDDFRYQSAEEAEAQYTNYQAIFDYINANVPGAQIQFGTLSDYFEAVMGTFDTPILKGSFFTYSDVDQDYWSGYFTSRVFDKALDRQLERALFAAESMGGTRQQLQSPRRALSLFQHHDGVTGTARDSVVQDYAKRMYKAIAFTQNWMIQHLQTTQAQLVADVLGASASSVSNNDGTVPQPCWVSSAPRDANRNRCSRTVLVYNPLETPQWCGTAMVPGKSSRTATLPCETAGPVLAAGSKEERRGMSIVFDETTGLMKEPIREEWKVWKVNAGGAYLFVPGQLVDFGAHDPVIEQGEYIVTTDTWKRTVVVREVPVDEFGPTTSVVIDFIYETYLTQANQEWIARFSRSDIANDGVFHTDLNGFNFDTHRFRSDMPVQSQVFPMPTLASIEDAKQRLTVLSEHAQGTASLENGSIDVWLDRCLVQDDARGLGQGVQDNRPTRTRFRLLLEKRDLGRAEGELEFNVTPLCSRMWEELQHPLQMFGKHVVDNRAEAENDPTQWRKAALARLDAATKKQDPRAHLLAAQTPRRLDVMAEKLEWMNKVRPHVLEASKTPNTIQLKELLKLGAGSPSFNHPLETRSDLLTAAYTDIVVSRFTTQETVVPFVMMVYKRLEYFKKAIESLRNSDFPRDRVPLIISHDGNVPEMANYTDSIRNEFNVIQLVHPYSCYEHPDSFPGEDETLNDGFGGDTYGNPRSALLTCCKHHFTWLMKTVFSLDFGNTTVNDFLFLEEDYIVAETVYSTIVTGLNAVYQFENESDNGFLGVGLDPTDAGNRARPQWIREDAFFADLFHSGPMTLSRSVYHKLKQRPEEYCKYDDYNWDWSMVHAGRGYIPHTILLPSRSQAKHIGLKGGLHSHEMNNTLHPEDVPELKKHLEALDILFDGKTFCGSAKVSGGDERKPFGGWSHPADQEHCMQLLQ